MLIGESVTYRGRRHVVVGLTPMSVRPFEVQLLDPLTDQTVWVEWPAAERVSGPRCGLRRKAVGGFAHEVEYPLISSQRTARVVRRNSANPARRGSPATDERLRSRGNIAGTNPQKESAQLSGG
jgi:hypothetical protein